MINHIDFVIPLHRYHYLFQTLLEAIEVFYSPRIIYIITPKINIDSIQKFSKNWKIKKIVLIDEETYFEKNYNLHYNDIYKLFNKSNDEKSREFGWWYQQIIKLSAFKQISNLSDPYVVWDSDLIPFTKWDIYPNDKSCNYKFAILQEKARCEWNNEQYNLSIFNLTGLHIDKPEIGTFVPHHFVFHHDILSDLINLIEKKNDKCWIKSIIHLSHTYFRFSEYHMISSFMKKYYPSFLKYHCYNNYGKYGERIRESCEFLKEMEIFLKEKFFKENNEEFIKGISYSNFSQFVLDKYKILPSYLQIEHI